jgi:alpha-galactosidase
LNQDKLGVQAKRIFTTAKTVCGGGQVSQPDKDYITDCDRVDVLAKPLSDGSLALCFLNLSQEKKCGEFTVGLELIKKYLGEKLPADFYEAKSFELLDLWSGEKNDVSFDKVSDVAFSVKELEACGNVTLKVVAR